MNKRVLSLLGLVLALVIALPGCGWCKKDSCKPFGPKREKCKPLCATVCPPEEVCEEVCRPVFEKVKICNKRYEESLGRCCMTEDGRELSYADYEGQVHQAGEEPMMKKKRKKSYRNRRNVDMADDAMAGA